MGKPELIKCDESTCGKTASLEVVNRDWCDIGSDDMSFLICDDCYRGHSVYGTTNRESWDHAHARRHSNVCFNIMYRYTDALRYIIGSRNYEDLLYSDILVFRDFVTAHHGQIYSKMVETHGTGEWARSATWVPEVSDGR